MAAGVKFMTLLPSDADLAKQALAGSEDAYRVLVQRYAGPAVNLATRMVRDRALAEDLAQEAFARAFDRLASYNADYKFSSWFFQILHNITVDHLRRKRVPSVSLDELQEAGHPGFADPVRLAAGRARSTLRGALRGAGASQAGVPRGGGAPVSRGALCRGDCWRDGHPNRHCEDVSVPRTQGDGGPDEHRRLGTPAG